MNVTDSAILDTYLVTPHTMHVYSVSNQQCDAAQVRDNVRDLL